MSKFIRADQYMSNCGYENRVIDSLNLIFVSTNKLIKQIRQDNRLIGWIEPDIVNNSHDFKNKLINFLQIFEYLPYMNSKQTFTCNGFLAGSEDTVFLFKELNTAKSYFRKSISEYKKYEEETISLKQSDNKSRAPSLQKIFRDLGYAKINLKQTYRKLQIVDVMPKKISWTWAHTKSIKNISLANAEDLILKKKVVKDRALLLNLIRQLDCDEKLAIVQEMAPHIRANIVNSDDTRYMLKGSSPIISYRDSLYLPFMKPAGQHIKSLRKPREDRILESEPYIKAFGIHRYQSLC